MTFRRATPTGGDIQVNETFGGPVHLRNRRGSTRALVAENPSPLGEAEHKGEHNSVRVLPQTVSLSEGVCLGYGILQCWAERGCPRQENRAAFFNRHPAAV